MGFTSSRRLGFMQGRLSNLIEGKIQAFPINSWENEFIQAHELGFHLLEWTVDYDKIEYNPLFNDKEVDSVIKLSEEYKVSIPSVTLDIWMQQPPWIFHKRQEGLWDTYSRLLKNAKEVGIGILVLPLVDNSSIQGLENDRKVISCIRRFGDLAVRHGLQCAIESDFEPERLRSLVEVLGKDIFGINYDIGNSASLGYDPVEELQTYHDLILNVHIKDRLLGGTTVPLGSGAARIGEVLNSLEDISYQGNYILQTARDQDNNHGGALCTYREYVLRACRGIAS